MKKITLLMTFMVISCMTFAQSFDDLSKEDKLMKMKEFRADNQNFLKSSLGLSDDQLVDIDDVNLCYLTTLDRIDRYASDENKMKFAKAATASRAAQLDAIMGPDNRKKYMDYIMAKLEKIE